MQIPFAIIKRGLGRDEVTRKVEPPLGKGDVLFPLVKREKRGEKKKKRKKNCEESFSPNPFNHYECVRRPETALKCIEYERGGAKKRGGKKREGDEEA